jgi:hypothetical protein
MYRSVKTPFIFHCEDDWQFDPIPVVADCFKALLAIRDASGICVRASDDLSPEGLNTLIGGELREIEGQQFLLCSPTAKSIWTGFTFTPNLLRRSLWEKHGPYAKYPGEAAITQHMKAQGFRLGRLVHGTCRHIGAGRHIIDPFQS